jgi:broad specificity phosphatase PhoE
MAEQKWPQTLWIVRHGQSAGNVARDAAEAAGNSRIDIAHRDMDTPLSALGERQADALARWFGRMPQAGRPTVILYSPYARARDTARRIAALAPPAGGVHPAGDERLREKEFGILDRLTKVGIEERSAHAYRHSHAPPGARLAARPRRQVLFSPARR